MAADAGKDHGYSCEKKRGGAPGRCGIAWAAAALLVALAALLAWRWAAGRPTAPKAGGVLGAHRAPSQKLNRGDLEPRHSDAGEPTAPAAEDAAARPESSLHPAEVPAPQEPAVQLVPGRITLPNGKTLSFKPPEEGTTTKVYASGHTYEAFPDGSFKDEKRETKEAMAEMKAAVAQNPKAARVRGPMQKNGRGGGIRTHERKPNFQHSMKNWI